MYIAITIIVAIIVMAVGIEIGFEVGYDKGTEDTYHAWAGRIGYENIEDDYYIEDFTPTEELNLDYKPTKKRKKIKYKRRTRRDFKSMYERKVWFFGDVVKIKKPTKWNKCNVNKMIKELEEELRKKGELDEGI